MSIFTCLSVIGTERNYAFYTFIAFPRGGSRAAASPKMKLFVTMVNGWKPSTIVKKSSIFSNYGNYHPNPSLSPV